MKIDGIWGIEFHGLEGWERIGTAFLENGRYLAASANHYSIGSYEKKKKKFRAKVNVTQYGETRVVFRQKKENFDALFKGTIKESGSIVGKFYPTSGEKNLEVNVRFKRLGKL